MKSGKRRRDVRANRKRRHYCDNCSRRLTDAGIIPLGEMKGLAQRVSPGEIVPSGECRQCGAVTHLINGPVDLLKTAAEAALDRLEGLYDTTSDEDYGGRKEVRQRDLAAIQGLRSALSKVR